MRTSFHSPALRLLACLGFLLAIPSCAGYRVQPIDPSTLGTWSKLDEGYIIYEPEPVLRVTVQEVAEAPPPAPPTPAGAGAATPVAASPTKRLAIETAVEWWPNRNRPYRVSTYAWLATAEVKLDYRDGWMLTGAASKVDTTAIAKALVDVGKTLAGGRMGPDPDNKPLSPGVHYFRILDNWKLELILHIGPK